MTPAEQVVKALRVLLMVERDGRVVCAARDAAARPDWWVLAMAKDGTKKLPWWLVQAESAEAARAVVAAHVEYGGGVGEQSLGRILASGGRK